MCIQAFFIRGGNNWGHRSFFPAHTNDVPEEEVLTSFLTQFYEAVPPPKLILLARPLGESQLLAEALSERAGCKVTLSYRKRVVTGTGVSVRLGLGGPRIRKHTKQ